MKGTGLQHASGFKPAIRKVQQHGTVRSLSADHEPREFYYLCMWLTHVSSFSIGKMIH